MHTPRTPPLPLQLVGERRGGGGKGREAGGFELRESAILLETFATFYTTGEARCDRMHVGITRHMMCRQIQPIQGPQCQHQSLSDE